MRRAKRYLWIALFATVLLMLVIVGVFSITTSTIIIDNVSEISYTATKPVLSKVAFQSVYNIYSENLDEGVTHIVFDTYNKGDTYTNPFTNENIELVDIIHTKQEVGEYDGVIQSYLYENYMFVLCKNKIYFPQNCNNMFKSMEKLQYIKFENINTSEVKYMAGLFWDCFSLVELDLSMFETQQVTSMYYMFRACSSLQRVNVSSFNIESITTTNNMGLSYMFQGCSSLTELDLSSFKTGHILSFAFIFSGCQNLERLNIPYFDTSSAQSMAAMFSNCKKMTSFNLSRFDTSNVETMRLMFSECDNLQTIDISSFDTSKVIKMDRMFNDCKQLKVIYIGMNWTTSALQEELYEHGNILTKSDEKMFSKCFNLPNFDENLVDKTKAHLDTEGGYLTRKTR